MSDIYPITLTRYNDLDEAGLIDANQMYQIYSTEEDIAQELIRTRKAMDLAFEMLKDIKNDLDTNDELTQEIADRLSEITALIQGGENE